MQNNESLYYWAGFLFCDGSIDLDRERIIIQLCNKDKDHLDKLKSDFNIKWNACEVVQRGGFSNGSIHFKLQFKNRHLWDFLIRNGMSKLKKDRAASEKLKNNRHFWRGCIDADGTVGVYQKMSLIRCSGTFNLMTQLKDYFSIISEYKGNVNKHYGIYCVMAKHKIAKSIIENLYIDSNIYLDRKGEKAIDCLNLY